MLAHILDKIQADLTALFPVLMTRKVAFGAALPVDLLVVFIYVLMFAALYGFVRLVRWWFGPPPVKMYTYVMPLSPHKVWPPPIEEAGYAAEDSIPGSNEIAHRHRESH